MKVLKSGQWLLAVLLTVIGSIGHASMNYSNSAAGRDASVFPDLLEMDTGESVQARHRSSVNSYRRLKEIDSITSNFDNLPNNVTQFKISLTFQPSFDATGHLITSFGVTQSLTIIGTAPSHHAEFGYSSDALVLLPEWKGAHYNMKRGSDWSTLWLSALYSSIFNNMANALDHNITSGTLNFPFGSFVFSITPIPTVSSVPLPGAVWLFGSFLFGMIACFRKNILISLFNRLKMLLFLPWLSVTQRRLGAF